MSSLLNELNRNKEEFENYWTNCDQDREAHDCLKMAYDEQTSLTEKLHNSISTL